MRPLLRWSLAAFFLCGSCDLARSQGKKDEPGCADSASPIRIRVEVSPPEVVVVPATGCNRPGLFHRICHHQHRYPIYPAPTIAVNSLSAPAAPMIIPFSPMTTAAPTMTFSPMMSAPMMSAPTTFAPMAFPTTTYAASPMVMPMASYPAAPMMYMPAAPAAPTAPPAPAAPTAANELNDTLKKLTASVETLNKMVRQQTKILEYHENRLDDLEERMNKHIHKTSDGKDTTAPVPVAPVPPKATGARGSIGNPRPLERVLYTAEPVDANFRPMPSEKK